MALDLIRDADGDVLGVTALEMETGDVYILEAKTTLFATGGAGRIFAASTNAFINTGDGLGMAARAGIRCRTWSSGSSTRPAWPARAC
jgi:succinate dehydrogenase / fumarate reductase flavoprotein subunit